MYSFTSSLTKLSRTLRTSAALLRRKMKFVYIPLELLLLLAAIGIHNVNADPEYTSATPRPEDLTEENAAAYIKDMDSTLNKYCTKTVAAEWDFNTDLTDENKERAANVTLEYSEFKKQFWMNITAFDWKKFKNPRTKRLFKLESVLGTNILEPSKLSNFTSVVSDMVQIYSNGKICDFRNRTNCNVTLEDITVKMGKSRDPAELKYLWTAWHDVPGQNMSELYAKYVELSNEAARLGGFRHQGEVWAQPFETDFLELEVFLLYGQLKPLYEEFHAYVRRRLRLKYGAKIVPLPDGPIPVHLLGNMWGQSWQSLSDILAPYKGKPNFDITNNLIKQNYTVLKIFQTAEDFFTSIRGESLPEEFWTESIFVKDNDKDMVCHPSAWDFCNGIDYRVKSCMRVNMQDFITVHHEMGHIAYYMAYRNLTSSFRDGANPAFHEAIGDVIALSVSSTKHLKLLGLLPDNVETRENQINFLFTQASKMLVDIPFALILDQWRWDVFNGKIKPEQYNCHWWKLRAQFQGVTPAVPRNWTDFDPGAKFHIPNDISYVRYFLARILTFQIHEGLCKTAGEYDPYNPSKPLHLCDIYKNKAAGAKFLKMLKMGSSRPWPEALEVVTGSKMMSSKPILNYFKPLYEWLKTENAKTKEQIGWFMGPTPYCNEHDVEDIEAAN